MKFKHVLGSKGSGQLSVSYTLGFLQQLCQVQRELEAITAKEFKKPDEQESIIPK
jgi:hypothetical protein